MTTRTYWLCQLSGWTLYATANLLLGVAYSGPSLSGLALSLGVSALGLAATHAFRALIRRRGWMALAVAPMAWRMVAGSTAAAFAMAGVAYSIGTAIGLGGEAGGRPVAFLGMAFNWTALLLIWSLLYAGVHLLRRWRETERERAQAEAERWRLEAVAREAELRALQAQVNPHFLFNSLNTVRALIADEPARAREAVTELADLLRYALAAGRFETVPLGDEMATVRRYLALEALRFEDRLRVEVEADAAALAAQVPPMAIQTLVENGIKHGIGATPEGGTLRVCAEADEGTARVSVESPGVLDPEAEPESGLGLANATARLRRLCGEHAALTVLQATPTTVRAEVLLPLPQPALA